MATTEAKPTWRARLSWFALLYIAGGCAMAVVAYALKALLR